MDSHGRARTHISSGAITYQISAGASLIWIASQITAGASLIWSDHISDLGGCDLRSDRVAHPIELKVLLKLLERDQLEIDLHSITVVVRV